MKRFAAMLLCMLLALSQMPAASANSWGLTGALYGLVSTDRRWDDYISICKQAGDAAVLGSRYHNALMLAEADGLRVYTRAVYQPEDGRDRSLTLAHAKGKLTLAYGEQERYVFEKRSMGYVLIQALCGGLTVTPENDEPDGYIGRYVVSDGAQSVVWQQSVTLADFTIALFPRTLDEVRQLNHLRMTVERSAYGLFWRKEDGTMGRRCQAVGKGKEPVYSAPFGQSAWRAAKGKAAVGLGGELWTLFTVQNAEGDSYTCIRYEVSARTQRIGYVRTSALGDEAAGWENARLLDVEVYAAQDTYLTDDPEVSQYPQFQVPAGTRFVCMDVYGSSYAYVAAEVRDGKFVDGGAIVWGFVPLKHLALSQGEVMHDVMAQMAGEWALEAGGNMAEDRLLLNADGAFLAENSDPAMKRAGTWYVTPYRTQDGLYWNDPPYQITMTYEDGSVNVKGLVFEGDTFSLTDDEGSGGWRREGT